MKKTEIEIEAEAIADAIYDSDAQQDLMEALQLLSKSLYVGFEEFSECKGLLIEIACLLTDPKVSKRISEDYYKQNAGAILKRMIDCFGDLGDSSKIQKYMTWYNLKEWGSRASEKDLEYAQHAYLNR